MLSMIDLHYVQSSVDCRRVLHKDAVLKTYSRNAHRIDPNNNEVSEMCYTEALEAAYQRGLAGLPLSDQAVFDLIEMWNGCRTTRVMQVVIGDTGIVPPSSHLIYRVLRALVGTEDYAADSWDIVYIPGTAEEKFATLPTKLFLAWFWVEYMSIQVQQDGNKRAGAMLVMYWLGRANLPRYTVTPGPAWKDCLFKPDPVAALAAIL